MTKKAIVVESGRPYVYERRLVKVGFDVTRFSLGQDVINYFIHNPVHTVDLLVAVGFALPDMAGMELLKEIIRAHGESKMRVLYLYRNTLADDSPVYWANAGVHLAFPKNSPEEDFYPALDQLMKTSERAHEA